MNNRKIEWVDISKGIVICLMVIGHSSIPALLSHWIWSFHMPFFFIISALFTSWNKGTFEEFSIRRAKILMIPFVIYSMINIVGFAFVRDQTIIEYSTTILFSGWGGVALWFVPVFYISLLVCKLTSDRFLLIIALVSLILGCVLSYCTVVLPWALSSVPFAVFLMMLTRRYRNIILRFLKSLTARFLFLISIAGIIFSAFIGDHWTLDMSWNRILPITPILIGILCGTTSIICISIMLTKNRRIFTIIGTPFMSIGRNTYEIMAISQVAIAVLNNWFNDYVALKYALLIAVIILAVYIRKIIEGKFANIEAI